MSVVLLQAASPAERFPGRWWVPPPAVLAAIAPDRAYVKALALERGEGVVDVWRAAAIWIDVQERDAVAVAGVIVDSELDCEGYGDGDRLAVPWDRILDLVLLGSDGEALFNEQRARFAIGKRVLVGVTVLSPDEQDVLERHAFVGTVTGVHLGRGIELRLDDATSYWLPPDASVLHEAPPGEYALRATGQTVVDPDYTATWTITHSGLDSFRFPAHGFAPPGSAA